jgi:hypothetical protein
VDELTAVMEFVLDVEAQHQDGWKRSCRIIRRGELAIELGGIQLLKPIQALPMHLCPALMQAGQARTFALQAFKGRRSISTGNNGADKLRL